MKTNNTKKINGKIKVFGIDLANCILMLRTPCWVAGKDAESLGCEIVELNLQVDDHDHCLIKVPAKVAISSLMAVIKGKSTVTVFSKLPELEQWPAYGCYFEEDGQYVATIGLDANRMESLLSF